MTTPHEMTEACEPLHCWIHHIDEPGDGAYRICGECFHAYPTARAMRRDYRHASRQAEFHLPSGTSWWRRAWRLATVRASRITFCQHCTHSF